MRARLPLGGGGVRAAATRSTARGVDGRSRSLFVAGARDQRDLVDRRHASGRVGCNALVAGGRRRWRCACAARARSRRSCVVLAAWSSLALLADPADRSRPVLRAPAARRLLHGRRASSTGAARSRSADRARGRRAVALSASAATTTRRHRLPDRIFGIAALARRARVRNRTRSSPPSWPTRPRGRPTTRARRDARARSPRSARGSRASCTTSSPTALSVMVVQAGGARRIARPRPASAPRRAPSSIERHRPRGAGRDAPAARPAAPRARTATLAPAADARRSSTRWSSAPRAAGLPVELQRRGRAASSCRPASTSPPTASCRRRSPTRSSTRGGPRRRVAVRYERRRARARGRRRRRRPAHGRASSGGGHGLRRHARARGAVRRRAARPAAGDGGGFAVRARLPARPRGAAHDVRVLIADDQALVRAGFRMILDAEEDIEVVGEAADGTRRSTASRASSPTSC